MDKYEQHQEEGDIKALMKHYDVESYRRLIIEQARHVQQLQKRLRPYLDQDQRYVGQSVREG